MQIYRHTNIQTNIHTYIQTYKYTKKYTYKHTYILKTEYLHTNIVRDFWQKRLLFLLKTNEL